MRQSWGPREAGLKKLERSLALFEIGATELVQCCARLLETVITSAASVQSALVLIDSS